MARSLDGNGVTVGSVMALGAGAVWSFGAITARLADGTDAFQYLIWRSLGIIVVVEVWTLVTRQPRRTIVAFRSGRRMMAANLALLVASIGFVYAVKSTSLADAAFLGSTSPLFGVVLGRWFLGERLNARTIATVVVAMIGLAVMFLGGLGGGNLAGDLAALCSALGFAAYTALVRSAPERDWSPVMPGYAVLMIAICAAVTIGGGNTLVPPGGDIALALLHGGLFIVGGTMLYNGASRSVPVGAMMVFAQTEMILVPCWAFLVLAERPPTNTVVGGAIILAAVICKAILDGRAGRTAAPDGEAPPPAPPTDPILAAT